MYIPQRQLENLKKLISPNKVVVIYGPRRCGKTTLINRYLGEVGDEGYLLVSGEDITVREYLGSQSIPKLKDFVGKNNFLVIDEAQKVKEIGLNLKLIIDHIKDIKIIATGSSSFDLARDIGEPLTGRKYTVRLFPQIHARAQHSTARQGQNLGRSGAKDRPVSFGPDRFTDRRNHRRPLCRLF